MNHREQNTMGARPRSVSLLLAAVLVVAVVVAAPAWAATAAASAPRGAVPVRYVSKTGSDTTGNGSVDRPWLTIQKAADSVPRGAVVTIGPGTYDERVTIPARAGGTSEQSTQFVADGAVTVTGGLDIRSGLHQSGRARDHAGFGLGQGRLVPRPGLRPGQPRHAEGPRHPRHRARFGHLPPVHGIPHHHQRLHHRQAEVRLHQLDERRSRQARQPRHRQGLHHDEMGR